MRKSAGIWLGIWLVAAIAAVYIRLYPLWGHIWSPTNEQATLAVIFNLKKTLLEQIHGRYPQMPLPEADRLASEKLNETLHDDNARVRRAIERVNQAMYKQSGTAAPVYLLESDPFYYYSLTENIATRGRMAETIQGNKYFNPLMGAPFGYWQPLTLHPYVGLGLYNVARLFDPDISLMAAVAFTPLVITVLAIGALVWCGWLMGMSAPSLLTACFYFCMAPVFLKRSSLGWYDTDPYNLLFPFILLGIFFKVIDGRTRGAWPAPLMLAGMLALYSLIWQGWIFLFFMTLMCAASIGGFAWLFQKDFGASRRQITFAGIFLGAIALGGILIYGAGGFLSFFTEGSAELEKFTVKGMNLWPNLFIEVGELKRSSFADLAADTGGIVFLLGALAGLVRGLLSLWQQPRDRASLKTVIIVLFLAVTVVLTVKAERFAIFTLVPLSLLFGIGLDWTLAQLKTLRHGTICAGLAITLLLCWSWAQANTSIRTVLTPIFNSAWNDALTAVRQKTPPDSIINTWWPPGHFIKAIAHRRVPFDGASLSEGQTGYWMSNILLSTDEDRAAGLLRMLNLSGTRAMDFLTSRGLKTSQAVTVLNMIAPQSPAQAKASLAPFLNKEDIEHLLLLTHGGFPHSYVLVYNELVDSNIGLAFTARRNLAQIEAINANPDLLARVPPPNSPEFIQFLWQLSGGPPKYSPALPLAGQDNDTLGFAGGINIRRDMSAALVNSPTYGQGIPLGVMFKKDGRIVEQEFPNANLNYVLVLYTEDGQPACRLMDKSLAESLLMRMFFFDGTGLKHFKPLTLDHDLTGRTQIKIFQAVWD